MPKATRIYFPATIMARAHCLARAARATGLSYRERLAAALRQSWATARATAARIAEQRARVLASIASLPLDMARAGARTARVCAEMEAYAARQAAALAAEDDARHLALAA